MSEQPRQVDPGFVYEIIALQIDGNTISEQLIVGWLFSDHGVQSECWAMKGPWESDSAAVWKRKPGRGKSTVIRFNVIAGQHDAGYPEGTNFETRSSSFFSLYNSEVTRKYVHTVEIREPSE